MSQLGGPLPGQKEKNESGQWYNAPLWALNKYGEAIDWTNDQVNLNNQLKIMGINPDAITDRIPGQLDEKILNYSYKDFRDHASRGAGWAVEKLTGSKVAGQGVELAGQILIPDAVDFIGGVGYIDNLAKIPKALSKSNLGPKLLKKQALFGEFVADIGKGGYGNFKNFVGEVKEGAEILMKQTDNLVSNVLGQSDELALQGAGGLQIRAVEASPKPGSWGQGNVGTVNKLNNVLVQVDDTKRIKELAKKGITPENIEKGVSKVSKNVNVRKPILKTLRQKINGKMRYPDDVQKWLDEGTAYVKKHGSQKGLKNQIYTDKHGDTWHLKSQGTGKPLKPRSVYAAQQDLASRHARETKWKGELEQNLKEMGIYSPELIKDYSRRITSGINRLKKEIRKFNKGKSLNEKVSFGHIQSLQKGGINVPENVFIENLLDNVRTQHKVDPSIGQQVMSGSPRSMREWIQQQQLLDEFGPNVLPFGNLPNKIKTILLKTKSAAKRNDIIQGFLDKGIIPK